MDLNDEIARFAYELWDKRGREHGKDCEDWYEAEIIVSARYGQSQTGAGKTGKMPANAENTGSKKTPAKPAAGRTRVPSQKTRPARALKK